jgi:hypothetical protein
LNWAGKAERLSFGVPTFVVRPRTPLHQGHHRDVTRAPEGQRCRAAHIGGVVRRPSTSGH